MTDEPTETPEPSAEELLKEAAQQRGRALAMNTEAARAGLNAAALDMLDMMKENKVDDAEAAVISGAIEAGVQIWFAVALRQGVTAGKARATITKEIQRLATKHIRLEQRKIENEQSHAMLEQGAGE